MLVRRATMGDKQAENSPLIVRATINGRRWVRQIATIQAGFNAIGIRDFEFIYHKFKVYCAFVMEWMKGGTVLLAIVFAWADRKRRTVVTWRAHVPRLDRGGRAVGPRVGCFKRQSDNCHRMEISDMFCIISNKDICFAQKMIYIRTQLRYG